MHTSTRVRAALTAIFAASALVFAGAPAADATTAPGTVTGTVTDSGTGVQDIQVGWLIPSSGANHSVQTAADGTYSLTLPTGTSKYYILVNADPSDSGRVNSTYLAEFFGSEKVAGYAFQTLAADTSRKSFSLDAALETGGSVSGTSTDLADADIDLVPVGGSTSSGYTADGSGNFSFSGYAPGSYQLYSPAHGSFGDYRSPTFTLSNGQSLIMDPVLPAGDLLEGTISGDFELSGVRVRITDADGQNLATAVPDESGFYEFPYLSVGTYSVSVGDLDANPKLFAAQTFTAQFATAGQSITHNVALADGATVTATPDLGTSTSGTYQARLTDSAGSLVDETARTGGSFSFSGIAAGNYTLGIADDPSTGYYSTPLTITAGEASNLGDVELSTKAIAVSGTVSGGKSGTIRFSESNSNGTIDFLTVSNFGTSGKYSVKSLLPGTYDVSIVSSGREVIQHTITVSTSKTMNYAIGPKLIPVKGTVLLEGGKLQDAVLFYGADAEPEIGISDGALTGLGHSGTYSLASSQVSGVQGSFQEKSPFVFSWPKSLLTITLAVGHTTNLGTRSVTVVGGS